MMKMTLSGHGSSTGGTMKHLRHVAARLLGKTRMGGFYVYWAIAE
jgi:hypothetical protein